MLLSPRSFYKYCYVCQQLSIYFGTSTFGSFKRCWSLNFKCPFSPLYSGVSILQSGRYSTMCLVPMNGSDGLRHFSLRDFSCLHSSFSSKCSIIEAIDLVPHVLFQWIAHMDFSTSGLLTFGTSLPNFLKVLYHRSDRSDATCPHNRWLG
jgi:hypothetical protein